MKIPDDRKEIPTVVPFDSSRRVDLEIILSRLLFEGLYRIFALY